MVGGKQEPVKVKIICPDGSPFQQGGMADGKSVGLMENDHVL